MGTDIFFQGSQAQIPKCWLGQEDFIGFKSPYLATFTVIYLISGPEKVLISSCSSESLRITWNKKLKFGLQDYVPPVSHSSVESISEPRAVVLGWGSTPHGESRKTKTSSLVAGYEPTASQVNHQSSITSFREEPHTCLHTHTHTHTHTPIHRVHGSDPSKSTLFLEMPGLRQREAGSNVLTFRGHRILFTSMLCSSTRAVCPSLGELGLTHTSWPPGPKLTGMWGT